MLVIWKVTAITCFALLSGCGGGGTSVTTLPDGAVVSTPAFDTYTTDDTGFSRVRYDKSTSADASIIAQFEDADWSSPEGYKSLITLSDALYAGSVTIEVLAQITTDGGTETTTRILRLTADQTPFLNEQNGELIAATGKYYLRGQNFVWATIGGGDLLSGSNSDGLENLVLDFDTQTASINLRATASGTSTLSTEITAVSLFNIRTGAYGGDITVKVKVPGSITDHNIYGSLRGNIGGTPAYTNSLHGMTTSGLYTATGTVDGVDVSVDGVFFGTDPNAIP
ncbi:viral aspartic protease [Pseudorhodobacter sp. W20_MBD10_FR17]|uniref:viral aspartic protease n=1 Tax=Pseudorhodobacter sp. W20_MBD10_FR17 TaxID=3240266 RepID=UPI003F9A14D9